MFSRVDKWSVTLICSRIDFGHVVYGSVDKNWLKNLDVIQAQALRLCLRAVKTMPMCALQVESEESPLYIRRQLVNS